MRAHIGEGCRLEGSLLVNKVAGNFHFSLTKADHHVLMSVRLRSRFQRRPTPHTACRLCC